MKRNSLWADRDAGRDGHEWLAPPPPRQQEDTPSEDPAEADGGRRRPRWLAPVASGLASAVLVVALLLATGVFDIGGGSDEPGDSNALPAAAPLKSQGGNTDVGRVYAKASKSVASIKAGSGSGTGFVVDNGGEKVVVTNAHVVDGRSRVEVQFGEGTAKRAGRVAGRDTSSDLAVVTIEGDTDKLPALELADSNGVRVGDQAIAIGNPFGLDRTATEGIVSATGRSIKAPNGFSIDDAIQTDAPINPGNSGGPLLDRGARVIGVNSQIETAGPGGGNVGVGFAVSSNTVREIVPRLAGGQTIARPYIGIQSTDAPTGGAEIATVNSGTPGDKAGLREGDIVTKVDGKEVTQAADVSQHISGKKPGDKVELEVERNGRTETFDITLGKRPASAGP
jgi:putative serine protease PepD